MNIFFLKKFKLSFLIVFICAAVIAAAIFFPGCSKNSENITTGNVTTAGRAEETTDKNIPTIEKSNGSISSLENTVETDSSSKENTYLTDRANQAGKNDTHYTVDSISENGESGNGIIFSFTVCGDSRPADDYLPQPEVFLKILNLVKNENPAFNMSVGDIINGGTDNVEIIKREFSDYLDALSILPVITYVTPGNHETQNDVTRQYFFELINLKAFTESIAKGVQIFIPGLNNINEDDNTIESINLSNETGRASLAGLNNFYYYFNFKDVYFIVLNAFEKGYWGSVEGNQLKWLKTVLESKKDGRIFIFIHTPVYSVLNPDTITDGSKHVSFSNKENLLLIRELFKEYKVDAVFSGHEHLYDLQSHDGTKYIITALSGEYPFVPREEGGFYHFVRVDVKRESWIFNVIESDGSLYYQEEITFN